MDPYSSSSCEIVEAKDDMSSQAFQQPRQLQKERQPLLQTIESGKSLRDDINKLFQSINITTSKSLDLSNQSRKNASKKPIMGVGPSNSPGIGFSEPLSLKQALRGLSISQAGEMAAMRRSSRSPGSSPGILDARRSTPAVYRSAETVESVFSPRVDREGLIERPVAPDEWRSNSLGKKHRYLNMKLQYHSSHCSPKLSVTKSIESSTTRNLVPSVPCKLPSKSVETQEVEEEEEGQPRRKSVALNLVSLPPLSVESTSLDKGSPERFDEDSPASVTVEIQSSERASMKEEDKVLTSISSQFHNNVDENFKLPETIFGSSGVTSCSSKIVGGASIKVARKPAPKLRKKRKIRRVSLSIAVRRSPYAVKPFTRNRILVLKSLEQKWEVLGSDSNMSEAVSTKDFNPAPLICHKCQCSLNDAKKGVNKDSTTAPIHHSKSISLVNLNNKSSDRKPLGPVLQRSNSKATPLIQGGNKTPKLREKGEFSQSSMSSTGGYSVSSSISDESNASGSSCGNRPHMSKDFRWEALDSVRKQHGFLGLKHFNLLKKLGSGDIGTVYLAELLGTNCLYAIKVMDNEFLARRKKMPRAQTEREILRMLDHPFLPSLYTQFTSDNLSCLVMEFCPGGDLHVLRQRQPGRCFPEQAARFYVAEVLLALEYLHLLGIIYRDLKPENILVREDGHIMVTDFDLSLRCSVNPTLVKSSSYVIEPPRMSGPCAGSNCIDPFCSGPSCKVSCFSPRILPATTRTKKQMAEEANYQSASSLLPQLVAEPTEARSNSFVGTHEYLAPEIIKGEGHGSAVDWWTLGIFLYELLYGTTPFKGSGNDETLTNVVSQSLKFPDSPIISVQSRDLIRGLLVKEPENRLGTETGAAEIKRHSFFEGLNWALIRCGIPPQIPEPFDVGTQNSVLQEKEEYFEGEKLEFEMF